MGARVALVAKRRMAISWASTRCQPRSVRGLVVGRLPGSGSVLAILEAAAVGVVGGGSSGITFVRCCCGMLTVLGVVLFCGCIRVWLLWWSCSGRLVL